MATEVEQRAEQEPRVSPDDISLFELLTPLLRRWKLIARTALLCGAVTAVALLLKQPVYTARSSFTPETSSSSSLLGSNLASLAGLAGQLGLGTLATPASSPEFFVKVAESEEILRSTLLTEFPDPRSNEGTRRPLLDILQIKGPSPEARVENGIKALRKRIDFRTDKPTGVVTLEVEMPAPGLAAAVANHLMDLLNRFNLERRQSQSREQRRFTGERLAEAERDLRAAERAELAFLQRNRAYTSSPLLSFEAARLARDVQVKQQVYLTLTAAHMEARIAEARDVPVLTVIDSAVAPVQRSAPRRTLGTVVALVLGTLLGVVFAYVAAARDRVRAAPRPDYLEFRTAWEQVRRRRGGE